MDWSEVVCTLCVQVSIFLPFIFSFRWFLTSSGEKPSSCDTWAMVLLCLLSRIWSPEARKSLWRVKFMRSNSKSSTSFFIMHIILIKSSIHLRRRCRIDCMSKKVRIMTFFNLGRALKVNGLLALLGLEISFLECFCTEKFLCVKLEIPQNSQVLFLRCSSAMRTASMIVCVLGIWWFITILLVFPPSLPRSQTAHMQSCKNIPKHMFRMMWSVMSLPYITRWLKINPWISLRFWPLCQSYPGSPHAVGATCSIFMYGGSTR